MRDFPALSTFPELAVAFYGCRQPRNNSSDPLSWPSAAVICQTAKGRAKMCLPTSAAMSASISPLAQALRILKNELRQTTITQSRQGQSAKPRSAGASTSAGATAVTTALQGLPAKLKAARAKGGALPPAKALRLFIEAVLLDEMGLELQLDPAFGDLVERTCQAIEQDPDNGRLIADALSELEGSAE